MNRLIAFIAATGATAVLVAAASPAAAQERAAFTGLRAEVTAGYDSTRIDDLPANVPGSVSQARIGGAIGYDLPLGARWTLGAEIGAGFTLGDGRDYRVGSSQLEVDQGRDLDASLRLGYKAGDRTLLYAKAGWANSRYVARATTGTTTERERDDENGLRVGAGVEQMLGDKFYAKAEYRYTSYGHEVSRHQVLAGLGIRF